MSDSTAIRDGSENERAHESDHSNWPKPEQLNGASAARRPTLTSLIVRSLIVVFGAAVVAAATYVISGQVPATYTSSAKIGVQVSGTDVNSTTLGANNLANQYAQMVNATPVLAAASRALGDRGGIPGSSITGGTVAAQNLVSVQATASTPELASRRAAAVAAAFIRYITKQVGTQATGYQKSLVSELRPVDTQIAQTRSALSHAGSSNSPQTLALEQTLNTLVAQRSLALGNIAQTALAGRPSVTLVSTASAGSQIAPKPKLYALVGFIVGLLIFARLAVYLGNRSRGA